MTEKNRREEPGDEWIAYPLSGPEHGRTGDSASASSSTGNWTTYGDSVYQCEVWVVRETGGEYSAFAAHLPGVVAQGVDAEEAIAEIQSAACATIRSYLDLGRSIPWTREPIDLEDLIPLVKRWVLIRA